MYYEIREEEEEEGIEKQLYTLIRSNEMYTPSNRKYAENVLGLLSRMSRTIGRETVPYRIEHLWK